MNTNHITKFKSYSNKSVRWPKISLVTPSYNQGHYIEETILSVIEQNYLNLEYIIIDGGSTDNTIEIIKKYEKYVSYWISEPDRGQSHAINKGVARCTGEIFNWLNSDDLLEDGALFHIAGLYIENRFDLLIGQELRFGDNIKPYIHPGTSIFPSLTKTVFEAHLVQPASFFRLEIIKKLNGVNENMHYLMDSHLFIGYLLSDRNVNTFKTNRVLSRFRYQSKSKTCTSDNGFLNDRWALRYTIGAKLGIEQSVLNLIKRVFAVYEIRFNEETDWDLIDKVEYKNYILIELLEYCYHKDLFFVTKAILRLLKRYNINLDNKLVKKSQLELSLFGKCILKLKFFKRSLLKV